MNKLWAWPLVVLLGLALMSCHLDDAARADAPEFSLNEPLTLRGGQEGLIGGEKLRVRFTDVLEDSRCPTQVECFWTGQARIAVVATQAQAEPTTLEFNTNPAPRQTRQTVEVGDYTVELKSLDPYPQTPDDATALADY